MTNSLNHDGNEDTQDYINFDYKKYKDFQSTFDKAFVFDSKQFFIGYAKYLLMCLETKFKKDGVK
jgi:hypothetical protein